MLLLFLTDVALTADNPKRPYGALPTTRSMRAGQGRPAAQRRAPPAGSCTLTDDCRTPACLSPMPSVYTELHAPIKASPQRLCSAPPLPPLVCSRVQPQPRGGCGGAHPALRVRLLRTHPLLGLLLDRTKRHRPAAGRVRDSAGACGERRGCAAERCLVASRVRMPQRPACSSPHQTSLSPSPFPLPPPPPSLQDVVVPHIMAANPGRPISPDQVLQFSDPSAANAWLVANPERCPGGIHFSFPEEAQGEQGVGQKGVVGRHAAALLSSPQGSWGGTRRRWRRVGSSGCPATWPPHAAVPSTSNAALSCAVQPWASLRLRCKSTKRSSTLKM
mgnify:CR=1 FL=1